MNKRNPVGFWWALLTLALLPAFLIPARAQGVEPLISPDEMLSVDQVRPGMKGVGRSVFEGTKIESFNVTVLGVLRKIDFGGDMILVRIDDGPPVTSGAGVSAGMSGSPIYVDGKLIGALAFAWPFAKQPLAGVTPIAQMLENYRPGSAPPPPAATASGDLRPQDGPLKLDGQLFSRATVVPDRGLVPASANGTLYLTPVATPIMVSGMGRPGMEELRKRFSRFSTVFTPGPGAVSLPPDQRPRLEPGSAVGVQLLGGDIDATGIGTVTYVKGNVVLAFGHPMFGLGTLNMPLTTAWIHGVIPSQEVSFKMGAPVETVGRLSQDRNWAIGGEIGEKPRTIEAQFLISDSDRGVKRDYKLVSAVHRDLTANLLYGSLMSAVGSVSPPNSGTTRGIVEVWAQGLPPIKRENVFSMGERKSAIEQLFGDPFAGMPLVELLQILDTLENSTFGSVPVERLRVTVDVSEARRTATIERAYADRKRVKPGDTVKLGVVIRPASGDRVTREFEVTVPQNIPGGRLLLGVAAGGSAERIRQLLQITRPPAKTLAQLVSQISDREQNNELVIEMAQPVMGVSVAGRELPNLPNVVVEVLTSANPSGIRMLRSHTRQKYETSWVLSGGQLLSLQVDADEKDKSGPAAAAGTTGLGGFSSLLDLFRLGAGGDFGGELQGDPTDGDAQAESTLARLRLLARYLAAQPNAPSDPPLPSFEELQRLLDSMGAAPSAGSGGTSAGKTQGVGRSPGVWRLGAARDFAGGKLEGVLVSSRGGLALAPQAKPLLTSPDRFFWAQATAADGSAYVGGWLDGRIDRIDPEGRTSLFFEGKDEVAITALTFGKNGELYAAAEPSGSIYRIDPSGQGTVLCRLPGERVWVLKQSGDTLYAGTGSEGRLYRISADGKADVAFTAPDRHILSIAADGDRVYCATYPRGKIFRLAGGKVDPVYELPTLTATALALDKTGNLYIGTSPKATVVRLTPSGDATTLFTSSTEKHVFSLLLGDAGEVYAAVGPQARVYRIEADRAVSTLWEPQAAYVLSLSRDDAGRLHATTAGPTQVVRLTAQPSGQGTFTSAVLNAGNTARWGAVRWTATAGEVRIQTRSGATAYPDLTWSGWSEPYTSGQQITSPAGQYLQYRVTLQANGKAEAALRSLDLFYRARNRAPDVTVKSPNSEAVVSGSQSIEWTAKDPDGDRLTYDVFYAPEGRDQWVKIGSVTAKPAAEEEEGEAEESKLPPSVRLGKALAPRRPVVVATCSVPGARRPVSTRRPVQVGTATAVAADQAEGEIILPDAAGVEPDAALMGGEEGFGPAVLAWDTRKVKDGRYRVKVVASDAVTSPDEPATAEAISEAFLVDNSAPEILMKAAKRVYPAPPLEITVRERSSYVASAEYRVDSGEWFAAAAVDGIFDSPDETIKIDPKRLPAGRHVLFVRARDAAGTQSWAKTVYVKK